EMNKAGCDKRARQSAPAPDCPKAYRSQNNLKGLLSPQGLVSPTSSLNLNRSLSPQGLVSPTSSLNLNRSLSPFLFIFCALLTFSCTNTDQDSSVNSTGPISPEI